jgi:hypothetical protein
MALTPNAVPIKGEGGVVAFVSPSEKWSAEIRRNKEIPSKGKNTHSPVIPNTPPRYAVTIIFREE